MVQEIRNNGTDKYVSEPYISSATGNKCITFSRSFKDLNGKLRILCIDVMQSIRGNHLI